jgi:hypothetical protein
MRGWPDRQADGNGTQVLISRNFTFEKELHYQYIVNRIQ